MVDEALRADGGGPVAAQTGIGSRFGSVSTPRGFAARFFPANLVGHWLDVLPLPDGRTGVLLGYCTTANAGNARSEIHAALRRSADPAQCLAAATAAPVSALVAVIDDATIRYSTRGDAAIVMAAPGASPALLDLAAETAGAARLLPGATLLLCTGPVGGAVTLLDDCSDVRPADLADEVIATLDGPGRVLAVLYRHPPAPLSITLPANPDSLSISRGRLRNWLSAAALEPEAAADVLLAVGEATANATEHGILGAANPVQITVTAAVKGDRLELTVRDNGRWKPPGISSGHRGHGIHLINALVDTVELRTGEEGTTVSMIKDLSR